MKHVSFWLPVVVSVLLLASCQVQKQGIGRRNFQYEKFKASFVPGLDCATDTLNILDAVEPVNVTDSLNIFFSTLDSFWKDEKHALRLEKAADRVEKKIIRTDIAVVRQNLKMLASLAKNKSISKKSGCIAKECPLVAEVVKSKQVMYLYIAGELKDSFAVSTGIPSRETPNMNVRASGPLFIKYTSRKYPEGNYSGLGNMPYAVFVKGGYAIHGTTPGNFAKLGRKASHGCIRLHPDNAKLFFELVNVIGLNNTWVIVR